MSAVRRAAGKKPGSGLKTKKPKAKKVFSLRWLLEPLEPLEGYLVRPMFGCLAVYLGPRLVLVLAENASDQEWNGVLFPVEREVQPRIRAEFPVLRPHTILPKWLYLPMTEPEFEAVAAEGVERICQGDPRFGTIPPVKKPRKKTRRSR